MKKKIIKRVVLGITVSCLLIGSGFYFNSEKNSNENSENEVKYSYVEVKEGDIIIDLMADGQIDIPIKEYYFRNSGDIASINVNIGQEITTNDELAMINTDVIENSLIEAKLNLDSAILNKSKNDTIYSNNVVNYNYQLEKLKGDYEVLKSMLDEMKILSDIYASNDIENSEQDYEKALQEYENYKIISRPVSTQESDAIAIEKAEIAVDKLKSDLENTIMKATSEGIVIDISGNVGDSITTSQVVLKVEEEGPIYVSVAIQEIDILSIFEGQKAYIEIEAIIGKQFEAKVISINRDPIVDNNGIVSYEVTLELVEESDEIMDGMTVSSTFVILEKLDIITIPNKAVKKVGSVQVVNVVTGENTAEEREIVTGLTDGKNVEVLSGLSINETLVYEN